MLNQAIAAIEAQQKDAPAHIRMMGEQLKDLCRGQPHNAELVAQDLENKELSLKNLAKQFKEYADKHKEGNVAVVTPQAAEQIIREFYGLGEQGEDAGTPPPATPASRAKPISFLDLLAKGE